MSETQVVRISRIAAFIAAPLWAMQALIWIFAPKVQERAAPHAITNGPLFEMVWLSVAGAVALSALAARAIPVLASARPTRLVRVGNILLIATGWLAAVATVSIAIAPVSAVQQAALSVMTATLYGAALLLAVSLIVLAVASRSHGASETATEKLPSVLAVLATLTLLAILASGTSSNAGLYVAVLVVVLDGAAWLSWGLRLTRYNRRDDDTRIPQE